MHEDTLMQRISSNMDKLLAHIQRDIKFRKANKKIQYPVPRINPRSAPPGSAQEIHTMKDGIKDEGKNIMQIAFLPQPEEGTSGGSRMIMPGEDIPDAPGRCREEERRSNLSVNTNTAPSTNNRLTQGAQPCHTDRAADRTVNFQDREQHRTNVLSEVQQNLMNISNSRNPQDQMNNVNVHSDRPDHTEHQNQNPWPQNADHSCDNQSSDSSDTDSIATGTATGKTKSAQHVDFVATNPTIVKRKEKEFFTATGVRDTHIAMLHAQGNATQAPPGCNTKAIIHPGQTTTQYHQQSQTTITTTTTTQGCHQHPPVLGALQTPPSSS